MPVVMCLVCILYTVQGDSLTGSHCVSESANPLMCETVETECLSLWVSHLVSQCVIHLRQSA